MLVAVHGKEFDNTLHNIVEGFFKLLQTHQFDIIVSESFMSHLVKENLAGNLKTYAETEDLRSVDFMFTLGGDGTILEAVTQIGPLETPIIGVNMGRLGFLATIGFDQIENALKQIQERKFTLDQRVLLKLKDDNYLFGGTPFALNDFTIIKKDTSSMIVVKTFVDGEFLNAYWADGLIVSTPTGSTGYSLSCGGPLVLPQSNNFIITPVSAHNLNVRPMVIGDNSTISFKIGARVDNVLISLDSRSVTIPATTELTIEKEKFKACLVKFDGHQLFDTLRQKLFWGLDARN